MTVRFIIFDFDGTVADTFDAIVDIINQLAPEFGYKQTTQEELIQIRKMTSREIIKQSGVPLFQLPFLLKKVKIGLNNKIHLLTPIPGMKEALIDLARLGYRLGIITSNDRENVVKFLQNNDFPNLFDFIYSGTSLFGKSKVINKFLKQHKLKREEIIYIGDETRDIDAAKKSHIKVIAVAWGFNSKEVLLKQKPDFLANQPNELISIITTWQNKIS
ncbi:MAG TPA: HAD-IA family hydrolase [Leptolyngbyaceae cyanobacterium]